MMERLGLSIWNLVSSALGSAPSSGATYVPTYFILGF